MPLPLRECSLSLQRTWVSSTSDWAEYFVSTFSLASAESIVCNPPPNLACSFRSSPYLTSASERCVCTKARRAELTMLSNSMLSLLKNTRQNCQVSGLLPPTGRGAAVPPLPSEAEPAVGAASPAAASRVSQSLSHPLLPPPAPDRV